VRPSSCCLKTTTPPQIPLRLRTLATRAPDLLPLLLLLSDLPLLLPRTRSGGRLARLAQQPQQALLLRSRTPRRGEKPCYQQALAATGLRAHRAYRVYRGGAPLIIKHLKHLRLQDLRKRG